MSTQTTNLHLVKQAGSETQDVDILNGNLDLIDANVLMAVAQTLTAAQKAQAMSNLGLGASAEKAVANNLTTTAAGSVLDARQGKTLQDHIDNTYLRMPIASVTDMDSIPADIGLAINSGFYLVRFATTTSNKPSGNSPGVCLGYQYTTNTESQFAVVSGSGKLHLRVKTSGTWGPWKTFIPISTEEVENAVTFDSTYVETENSTATMYAYGNVRMLKMTIRLKNNISATTVIGTVSSGNRPAIDSSGAVAMQPKASSTDMRLVQVRSNGDVRIVGGNASTASTNDYSVTITYIVT
jgi:hypothetical protein